MKRLALAALAALSIASANDLETTLEAHTGYDLAPVAEYAQGPIFSLIGTYAIFTVETEHDGRNTYEAFVAPTEQIAPGARIESSQYNVPTDIARDRFDALVENWWHLSPKDAFEIDGHRVKAFVVQDLVGAVALENNGLYETLSGSFGYGHGSESP